MDELASAEDVNRDPHHAIPDLRMMPLDRILEDCNSVLDNALRQVRDQLSRQGENYAAHGTTP